MSGQCDRTRQCRETELPWLMALSGAGVLGLTVFVGLTFDDHSWGFALLLGLSVLWSLMVAAWSVCGIIESLVGTFFPDEYGGREEQDYLDDDDDDDETQVAQKDEEWRRRL